MQHPAFVSIIAFLAATATARRLFLNSPVTLSQNATISKSSEVVFTPITQGDCTMTTTRIPASVTIGPTGIITECGCGPNQETMAGIQKAIRTTSSPLAAVTIGTVHGSGEEIFMTTTYFCATGPVPTGWTQVPLTDI